MRCEKTQLLMLLKAVEKDIEKTCRETNTRCDQILSVLESWIKKMEELSLYEIVHEIWR